MKYKDSRIRILKQMTRIHPHIHPPERIFTVKTIIPNIEQNLCNLNILLIKENSFQVITAVPTTCGNTREATVMFSPVCVILSTERGGRVCPLQGPVQRRELGGSVHSV